MRRQLSALVLGIMTLAALAFGGTPRAQAALPPPALTAPSDGATLAVTEVTVAWDLPQGATQYHLQVNPANNDGPAVNLVRNAAGWFTIAAPPTWYVLLPNMTYTWRVRATDKSAAASENDASWGAWSEARTFRTPSASGSGIAPVTPANGAVLTGAGPATLRWSNANAEVFYYEVQTSGDSRFDPDPSSATSFVWWNLIHGGVTNPSNSWQTPALEAGRPYFWRVRPRIQGDGAPAAWSPTFTFQTPGGGGGAGITVASHRWFPSSLAGFVHVVGEVVNSTAGEVYAPRVTVSFFMPDGRFAGTATTVATLSRVGVGQRAGFRFLEDPLPGWSRYDLSVSYSIVATGDIRRPVVRNIITSIDGTGVLHLIGEVSNTTGVALSGVKVSVTLSTTQGQVVNVDSGYTVPDEISSGGIGAFDITFSKEYQGYANGAVVAEGVRR